MDRFSFESLGTMIEDSISTFSSDVAAALIANITPIIFTCVLLYFTLKGFMFLTGRAAGAIPDSVVSAFKIALIGMFALNAGNFVHFGIGSINGLEDLLLSSIAPDAANAWQTCDNIWTASLDSGLKLIYLIAELDIWDMMAGDGIVQTLMILLLALLFFIGAVILSILAFAIILLNKIGLAIALGFGPFFLCTLMFPLTRTWFDGWLKVVLTMVFTTIIMVAMLQLAAHIFEQQVIEVDRAIEAKDEYVSILDNVLAFLLMCLAFGYIFSKLPEIASGMIGGIAFTTPGLPNPFKLQPKEMPKEAKAPEQPTLSTSSPTSILALSDMRANRALTAALAAPAPTKALPNTSTALLGSSSVAALPNRSAAIAALPYRSLGLSS